ncbi:hypothetical protein BJV74DRAFT_832984 [Russula compacta]|nr:hypothetical protein BJV74DRAFT_832984 [Russula compacta]
MDRQSGPGPCGITGVCGVFPFLDGRPCATGWIALTRVSLPRGLVPRACAWRHHRCQWHSEDHRITL